VGRLRTRPTFFHEAVSRSVLPPLLGAYFRENFALEFALAKARRYRKSKGRIRKGEDSDRLFSFLVPAQRIHAALPPKVKTPFGGRLRQALNSANGLRPLAYEISIATHKFFVRCRRFRTSTLDAALDAPEDRTVPFWP
jgi:hypothetical protein